MFNDLDLILNFLLSIWDQFVPLYLGAGLFSIPFSLWVVRKLSKLIKRLA